MREEREATLCRSPRPSFVSFHWFPFFFVLLHSYEHSFPIRIIKPHLIITCFMANQLLAKRLLIPLYKSISFIS